MQGDQAFQYSPLQNDLHASIVYTPASRKIFGVNAIGENEADLGSIGKVGVWDFR